MSNCDDNCASLCPNCEVVERMWDDILRCGDRLTPFYSVHHDEERMWNRVMPMSCYTYHSPLLSLPVCDFGGTLRFVSNVEETVNSVYLAAVLRWNIWLSNTTENCRRSRKFQKYSQHKYSLTLWRVKWVFVLWILFTVIIALFPGRASDVEPSVKGIGIQLSK